MRNLKPFLNAIFLCMAVVLVATASHARPQKTRGDGVELSKLQADLESQGNTQEELAAKVAELEATLKSSNEAIIQLKAQLEDNNVKLFEAQTKAQDSADKLTRVLALMDGNKQSAARRAGGSGAQGATSDYLAPGSSSVQETGRAILLFGVLLLMLPLGHLLLPLARAPAAVRDLLVRRNLLLMLLFAALFLLLGFGLIFGPGGTSLYGNPLAYLGREALRSAGDPGAVMVVQLALGLTACSIVLRAMPATVASAGSFVAVLVFALLVYPLFAHWAWGARLVPGSAGWLEADGFRDFAGSSVVNALAACFALGCLWGKRTGAELTAGRPANAGGAIHLTAMAALLIAAGSFGLPGVGLPDNSTPLSRIVFACAGGSAAAALAALVILRIRLLRGLGGYGTTQIAVAALGGLVAILGGADCYSLAEAVATGAAAGMLVALATPVLEIHLHKRSKLPASLFAVHGLCGLLGTLAVGLFGSDGVFAPPDMDSLRAQFDGALAVTLFGLAGGLTCSLAFRRPSPENQAAPSVPAVAAVQAS
ncbi:MAG: hypothetical protein JNJ60_14380 [Rhodocyclaceae bacterium]|nr:hypothetical protein [Rhodocyclaceae bacterium]